MNGYRILFSELSKLADTTEVFQFIGSHRPVADSPKYMTLRGGRLLLEMSIHKLGVSGGSTCGRGTRTLNYFKNHYGQFL